MHDGTILDIPEVGGAVFLGYFLALNFTKNREIFGAFLVLFAVQHIRNKTVAGPGAAPTCVLEQWKRLPLTP